MLVRDDKIDTTLLHGIELSQEAEMAGLQQVLSQEDWQRFADQPRGLLLGKALARRLGVEVGDRLTLIVPAAADNKPRFEHLQLSGRLDTGTELDESAAFLHLAEAARLAGTPGQVHGYRLQLVDLFQASRVGWELISKLPQGFYAGDWTQTHGNLYAAIQLSRNMVGILLLSIIAIAAFNVVSSLVLVVRAGALRLLKRGLSLRCY